MSDAESTAVCMLCLEFVKKEEKTNLYTGQVQMQRSQANTLLNKRTRNREAKCDSSVCALSDDE